MSPMVPTSWCVKLRGLDRGQHDRSSSEQPSWRPTKSWYRPAERPSTRRADAKGIDFRARSIAPSNRRFPSASGTRWWPNSNPDRRSRARTSRSTAVSIDTRRSNFVMRRSNWDSASVPCSSATSSPKSTPDLAQGCGAWNLELWEQVGIAGSGDLRFDPMVIGTAFAMGHQANQARPSTLGSAAPSENANDITKCNCTALAPECLATQPCEVYTFIA